MKARITFAIGASLVVSGLLAAPVLADAATATNATQTETKSTDAQSRIAQRKAKMTAKVTAIEQKRLESRCKNAQVSVKKLQAGANGLITSRTAVYKNVTDRLTTLEAKLNSKSADTTELKSEIATLQTKIDSFKTDATTYSNAVSDVASMDCVADPTGFKASLEDARKSLVTVRTDAVGLRSYVVDTIKPTLTKIRASLATTNTTGTN